MLNEMDTKNLVNPNENSLLARRNDLNPETQKPYKGRPKTVHKDDDVITLQNGKKVTYGEASKWQKQHWNSLMTPLKPSCEKSSMMSTVSTTKNCPE